MNRHFSVSVAITLCLIGFSPVARTDQTAANVQPGQRTSRLPGFAESLARIVGLLNDGRGSEAEQLSKAVLSHVETTLGPDALEVATVLDLLGRAVRRSSSVTAEEKARIAERAVAIKEKILEPWAPELATSLTNLGIQRTLAGNPADGKTLLERAVAIREKAFGADDLLVAATVGSLAGVLMTLRDDAAAKTALERVLRIRESKYGAADIETIRTRIKIAVFYAEVADYAGARGHYDRALALAEQALGSNNPLVFEILLREAIVLSEGLGDYAAGAQLNERLVSQAEKVYGSSDRRLTLALRHLALDRRDLGEYAAARTHAERSLSIAERAFGPNHSEVADSLHTLATVLAAQGAYAEALQAFERATRIKEDVRRPANPELGRASWFIPDLFPVSGYDADDLPTFEQLIAMREPTAGLADTGAIQSLTNLAALLSTPEDYKRTRPLFERALAAQEGARDPEHPDIAAAATNLADVLHRGGDAAAARPLYERALEILERSLGPEHPRVATALLRLASLRSQAGDHDLAMQLDKRALSIQERHLGPAHPEVADTLTSLSRLEARTGATADAFSRAVRAEDIRREHIRLTTRTLAERQALAYATASGTSALDVMLSVAAAQPADRERARLAWNALIQSRGIVFDEMATRRRAAGATDDPDVAALTKAWTAARQVLSALVIRGIRNDPPERYRRLLDQARAEKERAERALAERSTRFRDDQANSGIGVSELTTSLPPNSALIGFATYRRDSAVPADRSTDSDAEGELAYLAFVLTSPGAPTVVPLGSAAAIDAHVSQWRRQIDQEALAGGRSTARGEDAYRQVAEALRARVWDPLRPYLAGVSRVFIVPDGTLHLVSFAALPTTRSRYFVETGPLLHYLSTERDLVTAISGPNAGGLLALGSPAFDEAELGPSTRPSFRGARSGCIDFQSVRFPPLPASLNEVNEVATLWNRAKRGAVRLIGAAATERAFKAEAGGHRVLHLATHGFFLGQRCAPVDQSPRVTRENPLLLSGLVLAGANRRDTASADQEDGVLTAEEVAALNLSGVEWAVLSGCDTGVGEIRAGEGVFGLRRAFRLAGARTVIMSLWPVEDRSTRAWMEALYRNRLLRNLTTADAIREASLSVLRERRARGVTTHPLYWAGFVAAGDWH